MFRSIHIERLRGITDLTIQNLDHINIITGKNNAGKTAVLESIFLHCSGVNPGLALTVNIMRGLERIVVEDVPGAELPWDSLFLNYDTKSVIEISSVDSESKSRKTTLKVETPKSAIVDPLSAKTVPSVLIMETNDAASSHRRSQLSLEKQGPKIDEVSSPIMHAIYVASRRGFSSSDDAARYGKLEIEKRETILVDALRVIEPRLSRIAVVVRAGEGILYGDIGTGRLLPLPVMGEGLSRLATIILTIAVSKDGVVLVDEIENGFHYSVLEDVWKAIANVARRLFVQVFATTHSLECIAAAHKAFIGSTPYDLRVHRLDRLDDKYRVATYDSETIEAALDNNLEIR